MDRAQFRVIENDCRDLPDADGDRVAYLDGQNVYLELGELKDGKRKAKPGEVSCIYRDELGWVACVQTTQHFTLDHEFPTLRQALDFAMEKFQFAQEGK